MLIDMTLTAKPEHIKRMIIPIMVMSIYSGFAATFLACFGTNKETKFQGFLELFIGRKLFLVCKSIASDLSLNFIRVFFSPSIVNSCFLGAMFFGISSLIFIAFIAANLNPLPTLATAIFGMIILPGAFSLCKWHGESIEKRRLVCQ